MHATSAQYPHASLPTLLQTLQPPYPISPSKIKQLIMFSVGRVLASRVAPRASLLVARQQPVRTFAASTFLDSGEVGERIAAVIKNFDKVDANKVTDTAKFTDDLGLDSLDAVEVVMAIEDEFAIEIPDAEADKILSVADAVEYISSHPMAK